MSSRLTIILNQFILRWKKISQKSNSLRSHRDHPFQTVRFPISLPRFIKIKSNCAGSQKAFIATRLQKLHLYFQELGRYRQTNPEIFDNKKVKQFFAFDAQKAKVIPRVLQDAILLKVMEDGEESYLIDLVFQYFFL